MNVNIGKHFGFTGTQCELTWAQACTLGVELDLLRREGFEWMHNGDCIGADWVAGSGWINRGGKLHGHPPSVNTKRGFLPFDVEWYPRPYRERNQDIVDNSELLLVCPRTMEEELRSGTWMTVRMARRAGVTRTFIWPDGTKTTEGTVK